MLAPDIGLKGRLDALWQDDVTSQLLELKTGTVRGDLPRREHRWQVHGYQALLAARGLGPEAPRHAATLLYSGTPGQAEAHTLPFALRDLRRVVELRNFLAITHAAAGLGTAAER
jgi:DNA replication ATP-dependent helicase Dna2